MAYKAQQLKHFMRDTDEVNLELERVMTNFG